jgi:hypothetical protein
MRGQELPAVIAGLDPAIQADACAPSQRRLDARVKPAHEERSLDQRIAVMQQTFAEALLDTERPVPFPRRRFAIYRNNVVVGLVDALAARFPATQRIVGEEFFRAMARLYVIAHPPRSPLLMEYGDDFPHFVAAFGPAAELPYLADVARLENARMHAYHAADVTPLDASSLRSIDAAALGRLHFTPHPAAAIIRSQHPIVTIWAMNAGERTPAPIDDWRGEDALIARPGLDVFVRGLPPGGATFLMALFAGATLGEAAEVALDETESFDLVASLAGMLSAGVMSGFQSSCPRLSRASTS